MDIRYAGVCQAGLHDIVGYPSSGCLHPGEIKYLSLPMAIVHGREFENLVADQSSKLDASASQSGTEGVEDLWRASGLQPMLEGQTGWVLMSVKGRDSGRSHRMDTLTCRSEATHTLLSLRLQLSGLLLGGPHSGGGPSSSVNPSWKCSQRPALC